MDYILKSKDVNNFLFYSSKVLNLINSLISFHCIKIIFFDVASDMS